MLDIAGARCYILLVFAPGKCQQLHLAATISSARSLAWQDFAPCSAWQNGSWEIWGSYQNCVAEWIGFKSRLVEMCEKLLLGLIVGRIAVAKVLVDAPCSQTGALRRNPDMKWTGPWEEWQRPHMLILCLREQFCKQPNRPSPYLSIKLSYEVLLVGTAPWLLWMAQAYNPCRALSPRASHGCRCGLTRSLVPSCGNESPRMLM